MIPRSKRAAMERVIDEIDRYRGAVIVRGKHRLWKAVVALEALSRPGPKFNKLDRPASSYWYYALWASRPDMRNIPFGEHGKFPGCTTERNPALAKQWLAKLKDTLQAWLDANRIDP